jgi:hypothetical protein
MATRFQFRIWLFSEKLNLDFSGSFFKLVHNQLQMVLKKTYNVDGRIVWFKVRSVAHGFLQVEKIDYQYFFSPLIKKIYYKWFFFGGKFKSWPSLNGCQNDFPRWVLARENWYQPTRRLRQGWQ